MKGRGKTTDPGVEAVSDVRKAVSEGEAEERNGLPRGGKLLLRLYVAGKAPNSVEAVTNLKAICKEWLADDAYELEVIDVLEKPSRALEDGVLVTPTLVKEGPEPVSIVGTLSDREKVRRALGLLERSA
jgi:circadian clock protein KaiB